jgi:hypothetical protein
MLHRSFGGLSGKDESGRPPVTFWSLALPTKLEDEDDDEYEYDLRQTRLTQTVDRLLYRLAGVVKELLCSASSVTPVVVYPPNP